MASNHFLLDTHCLIWFQENNQALLAGFNFLPIENSSIFNYKNIPLFDIHRDPFDRLLISTAIEIDATLLSIDEKFNLYPNILKLFWK